MRRVRIASATIPVAGVGGAFVSAVSDPYVRPFDTACAAYREAARTIPSAELEVEYALDSRVAHLFAQRIVDDMCRAGVAANRFVDLFIRCDDGSIRVRSGHGCVTKYPVVRKERVTSHVGVGWDAHVKRETPVGDVEAELRPHRFSCADALRVANRLALVGTGKIIRHPKDVLLHDSAGYLFVARRFDDRALCIDPDTGAYSSLRVGADVADRVLRASSTGFLVDRWELAGPHGCLALSVSKRCALMRPTAFCVRYGSSSVCPIFSPFDFVWRVEVELLRDAEPEHIRGDVRRFGDVISCWEALTVGCSASPFAGPSVVRLWPPGRDGCAARSRLVTNPVVGSVAWAESFVRPRDWDPIPHPTARAAAEYTLRMECVQRLPRLCIGLSPGGMLAYRQPYLLRTSFPEVLAALEGYEPTGLYTAQRAIDSVRFCFDRRVAGVFVSIRRGVVRIFCPFFNDSFLNDYDVPGIDRAAYSNGPLLCDKPCDCLWTLHQVPALHCCILEWLRLRGSAVSADLILNPRDSALVRRDGVPSVRNMYRSGVPVDPLAVESEQTIVRTSVPIVSQFTSDSYIDHAIPCAPDVALSLRAFFAPAVCRPGAPPSVPPWEVQLAPWRDRLPSAVFRGSLTGPVANPLLNQRAVLVRMGNELGDLCDFGLSSWTTRTRVTPGCALEPPPPRDTLSDGLIKPRMEYVDQVRYAACVVVQGNQAANRLGTMLYFGFLVFRVAETCDCGSTWLDEYARPYEHFVPVSSDLRDLGVLLQQYLRGDRRADGERIASRGMALARRFLSAEGLAGHMERVALTFGSSMVPLSPVFSP